jgi:hypothetical protein
MSEHVDNEANATPKTRKKISKTSSFLKSITLDLFRSKASKKVSKHRSLCERVHAADTENFDFVCADQSSSNSAEKPRGLFRSNSSCDKKPLKPILKRQTSFCESNGSELSQRPLMLPSNMRRRQNSMCEMDTGPKMEPVLRRQNSLIEYGRRGVYENPYKSFNMITTIDPIYQRMQKHEPFYPRNYVTNAVAKPERIYVSREPLYSTRNEVVMRQTQCPYSSRQDVINHQTYQRIKFESPYSNRDEIAKQRIAMCSPYSRERIS